jgi:hypothetical protein
MNAAQFMLQQGLRRHAQDCRAAEQRILLAQRLQEVVRLAYVVPPSLVASVARTIPETRQLDITANRRVEEICAGHLAELKKLADAGDRDAFMEMLGKRRMDWQCLRGHFPGPLQHVDREAQRLQGRLEQQRPPADRPRE